MRRYITGARDQSFDLVVVGGGIFGACAAADAAQRGMSVALIERDDFGGATSANSLKMVHGGIRYVQHMDIARVRHSAAERRAFLRIAPHLVEPLPIVIPTYGRGMKGKGALRAGMGIFDLLTADANRGIADPARKIPWCTTLSRKQTLAMYLDLEAQGLTGAALFSDAQMYNPCRLVLAFVQSAVEAGAVVLNHAEVTGFLRDGDAVTGVAVRDRESEEAFAVHGRAVLNAAGPYAERLLADASVGLKLKEKIVYSRDCAFVVNRPLTAPGHAVALQGTTTDPDAVVGRGARHMFVAPWRERYTLVGVWHTVYGGDPFGFTVGQEEIQTFLAEMNQIYPAWGLSLEDVTMWNAGLVPFGDNPDGASHAEGQDLKYGHRSHLIDHAEDHGLENLVTLIGVRYTTGRYEAARAVDLVRRKLGLERRPSQTASTPVAGGDIADIGAAVRGFTADHAGHWPERVSRALVRSYGTLAEEVAGFCRSQPGWDEPIGDTTTLRGQVVLAVRREMALTLADVVFRRTDLATGGSPGEAALADVADLMAGELSWSDDRRRRELAAVVERFPAWGAIAAAGETRAA
jgi:glycerol-3-phosphate dehydrogenase